MFLSKKKACNFFFLLIVSLPNPNISKLDKSKLVILSIFPML